MNENTKNLELAKAIMRDARWKAIVERNSESDGSFYYSVKTTGVYCRPSCGARLARPENVQFHATREHAQKAGFRPCKRCKPENQPANVTDVRRFGAAPVGDTLGATIQFTIEKFSLGSILVAANQTGICAILMGDDPGRLAKDLQERFPKADLISGDETFAKLASEVIEFVESPELGMSLPLDPRGTAFQQRVWSALRTIPTGSTASYREIAVRIGAPNSARAVAQACAANGLAVAIPCHRVVRNDGGLSGYRWGAERKRILLGREAKK